MWWLVFLFIPTLHAQTGSNLKAIQDLEEELPTYNNYKQSEDELLIQRQNRRMKPPVRHVSLEKIMASGTQMGSIPAGAPVRNLKNNKNYVLSRHTFVKYFQAEDENGFKYIENKDGSVKWRIKSLHVEPIKEELALYEPPLKYTPAPDNIIHADYDKKLTVRPEFSFYAGVVSGDYMADLFEDEKAKSGVSTQYGLHFFTDWKLPIKIGGVIHYEMASYSLTGGDKIDYSALSFGPQLKTREFQIFDNPLRFQTQFRISPLARASAQTSQQNREFDFNSYDVLFSFERPIKNRWGEFVWGLYFQSQWLNLRDQPRSVSVNASNLVNRSLGLSFSQVFQ